MPQYTLTAKCELQEGVRMVRMGQLFAQNDKLAHSVSVTVTDGGSAADLSGLSASGYFIRPDDATVTVPGTISGSTVLLTLPSACYEVPGRFSLILKIYDTDHAVPVFWADGNITRSETDSVVDPARVVPDLAALLAQIETIEAAVEAANAAAARTENMTVSASAASGSTPTATITTVDDHYNIAFGLVKGDKGDTGDTGKGVSGTQIRYQKSSGGSSPPSGTWQETPAAAGAGQGDFLWTRTVITYTDSTTATLYSVSYYGVDGSGAVNSVDGMSGDVTLPEATASAAGKMSAADKSKLDGIEAGANAYTLPTAAANTLGGIKVGSDFEISGGILSLKRGSGQMTAIWTNDYPEATFAGGALQLDLSLFDGAVVEYRQINTRGYTSFSRAIPLFSGDTLRFNTILESAHGGRALTVLPTGIIFEDAHSGATGIANQYAVPVNIYGMTGTAAPYAPDLPGWDYLIRPFDPVNSLITGFTATKNQQGNPADYCGWLYSEVGLGYTLVARPENYSWLTMVSNETVDLTDYSTLVLRCGFRGYPQYNHFGLIPAASLPADAFTATYTGEQQNGWMNPKQQLTTQQNVLATGLLTFDVSALTGNYYIAAMETGLNGNSYKTCILEARAQ